MPARLTFFPSRRPARTAVLREDEAHLLGRDPACSLEVDDDRVSRHHARLRWEEGCWRLSDLGSKNGTAVDGRPVQGEVELVSRALIDLGGVMVRFEPVSEAETEVRASRELIRLRTSAELQRRLSPSLAPRVLLDRLLSSVMELSETERGFVLLAGDDGELEVRATRGLDDGELTESGFRGSVGAVRRALGERTTVAVSDARDESWLGGRTSVAEGGIRGLVCLPLVALDRLVGAIYVDSSRPGVTFTELDVEILEALAHHAALAISVQQLDDQLRELADEVARDFPVAGGGRLSSRLAALRPGGGSTVAETSTGGGRRWRDVVARHAEVGGGA